MSYLLDTNVISELRRGDQAVAQVLAWRRNLAYEETFVSVLILGEMRRGVEMKRRKDPVSARRFEKWLTEVEAVYQSQILSVTQEICNIWGRIAAHANISTVDGLLAATAICHELTIATRNTKDFQRIGIDFINPFED